MRAFLTGATGFIGGHVARALVARGWNVVALVRSPDRAASLRELGVTLVGGDVTEPATLAPLRTCDAVFHLAAWYALGVTDRMRMYTINVAGTENVLAEAADAGVARIVHCSSVAVLGAGAPDEIRDETAPHPGTFFSVYQETKWRAHRAAHEFAAEGAPIVVVMPAAVYGPGDPSIMGVLWRAYVRGWLIASPGLDTGQSWVHVDDVAEGIALAHDKGRPGQDYLLGGDNATIREMFARIAGLTGIRGPRFRIPAAAFRFARPFGPALSRAFGQEPRFLEEGLRTINAPFMVSSEKAVRELGYRWRPIEEGALATVEWLQKH